MEANPNNRLNQYKNMGIHRIHRPFFFNRDTTYQFRQFVNISNLLAIGK